ncbi:hypothetical protein NCCNTM_12850 [Mycolicibacterium sp. NCC-Tsukiji]|nr:hypothetical protein NCCNTM_12850 [Mycolicibacterium sp. NCC-Tsukiji]
MASLPEPSAPSRFPTLAQQLYRLASGAVTSQQIVRQSLDAIAASQLELNAFRVIFTEQALADAAEADRKRAAGQHLPLLGVPIAIKDDVDVAGVPTRFGTDGDVPAATADAEVVRRLKAAGAVIVGKTNTCELGQWPFTSSPSPSPASVRVCPRHAARTEHYRRARRPRACPDGAPRPTCCLQTRTLAEAGEF